MKTKFELCTIIALLSLTCGCVQNACPNGEYLKHTIFDADPTGAGHLPRDLARSPPKIIGGRFYMKNKSFSILVPKGHCDSTIDEDGCLSTSMAIFRDRDTTVANMAVIETIHLSLLQHIPDYKVQEFNHTHFNEKMLSLKKLIPSCKVLYESEWNQEGLQGYFGAVEVPGAITQMNLAGCSRDLDAIRGYMVSVIDDVIVFITIQDRKYSFPSNNAYMPLEEIKTEFLRQIAEILHSFRSERDLSKNNPA